MDERDNTRGATAMVPVSVAIEHFRAGKMLVMVDDDDRENEGDIVIPAAAITADQVNFMAVHARGLICLALAPEACDRLGLELMAPDGGEAMGTAFTISIEAADGVTTGISAADRAHTMRVASAPTAAPADIVMPGHVFPLRARAGGVLERAGHTEGSVELARLAGLEPAAAICEVMNLDGTMARRDDLEIFCREHAIPMVAIADIIVYLRDRTEGRQRFVRQGPISARLDQAAGTAAGGVETFGAGVAGV